MGHMSTASDFVWTPGLVCKRLQMSGSGKQECSVERWNVKRPQELIFGTLLLLAGLFLSLLKITAKKVCSKDTDLFPENVIHSESVILYM